MKLTATSIAGVYQVDIEPHVDERGSFARTWDSYAAVQAGLVERFDYSCVSTNTIKGTLRGMHWQKLPFGETKLVRCTKGKMFDVATDVRPDSPTFKQWIGVELSAENHRALYIPHGCAHGFLTLVDETEVLYNIAGAFAPEAAAGARYDDPLFAITWPSEPTVLSDKDAQYPTYLA